jgi:hypothetical protein
VESLIVLDDGVNLLDRRCQGSAALYGFSFLTSQQYLCDAARDCDGLIRTSRTRSPCKKLPEFEACGKKVVVCRLHVFATQGILG